MIGIISCMVGSLNADAGVMSSVVAPPYTFVEIDREIFSTAILPILLMHEGLLSVTSESMCMKY